MNIRKKVLIGVASVLVAFFMIMSVNANPKVAVTLENCEPGTWVGMVQWTDNKKGYKDLPEAKIKRAGKLTVMLEPGEYAITHYRPPQCIKMSNDRVLIIPSKIIEFRDVVVTKAVTFSFGCKWNMKGAT